MKLIENGTAVDPSWVFWEKAANCGQSINQIAPVELFLKNPEISTGVQIEVDTNLDHIAPHLAKLALIVIRFDAYADGRGFSIAHRLRHSFEFTSKIWGSGSLISDQYALAAQCGIDAVLVDEQLLKRQPIEHWQDALAGAPIPYRYQDEMVRESTTKKHVQIGNL